MSAEAPSGHPCSHCGLPVPASRSAGNGPWFCCFGCRVVNQLAMPAAERTAGEEPTAPPSTLVLRLGLGIFLALNIMIASWLPYSRELFSTGGSLSGVESALVDLASYVALFLCTVVVALLGLPLLSDALRSLFAEQGPGVGGLRRLGARLNAQVLIVLGVFSAYLLSAVHTLRGEGSLYFDTAAMVLVVVTLGSYLEAGARQKATTSAHRLLAVMPQLVRVARGGDEARVTEIAVSEVRPGDRVSVRPGDVVPVDGRVEDGVSRVDESSLTGESAWRLAESGDRLLAGSQNLDGELWLTVERAAENTVLALMERSLAEARASRPPIQRLADRVASVFVPGVVLLALAVFGFHLWRGSAETGLLTALSVLLISCPCALGLAAPLACWQGLRRAAERGILIDSAATLERAAAVRHLFLDKTGTLSRPQPALERLVKKPELDEQWVLAAAASLEATSSHPIADSVVELARARGIEPARVEEAANVAGFGIEGRFSGRTLRLGSRRWVEALGLEADTLPGSAAAPAATEIFLMEAKSVLARFDLEEEPRTGAAEVVETLRGRGISAQILSGDAPEPTRRFASRLGLRAEGGLLPADKVDRLASARRSLGPVGMVGDGINDAPVLAAADVGVAMGSASELATRSGNVRLVSDRLDRLPLLFDIARHVRRRIRANLLFAFGFNSVGILLAAAGLLTPIFAAVAMVLSSLAVVKISGRAGSVDGARSAEPDAGSGPIAIAQREAVLEGRG